jgi:hypothetical protein
LGNSALGLGHRELSGPCRESTDWWQRLEEEQRAQLLVTSFVGWYHPCLLVAMTIPNPVASN